MKKFLLVLVAVFTMVAMLGCKPLADAEANYWATGAYANWGDAAGDEDFKMEAVAINDERIASLKKELKDATFIYVKEIVLPSTLVDWSVTYKIDGTVQTFNGNLTVKVLKSDAADESNAPLYWAQNKESGAVNNLTPETLYIAPYQETATDGEGTWADNPVALTAGTYIVVFAKVDGVLQMGLIAK